MRIEFESKAERNAFLARHGLSIAGSTARRPNVRDGSGRYVGYITVEQESRQAVEITNAELAQAIKRLAA